MIEEELEKLYIQTEHGTFTPIYTYDDFILNEETEECEYVGLVIVKTAQEVYDKWLYDKENPRPQEPSSDYKISILEKQVKVLEEENLELTKLVTTIMLAQ